MSKLLTVVHTVPSAIADFVVDELFPFTGMLIIGLDSIMSFDTILVFPSAVFSAVVFIAVLKVFPLLLALYSALFSISE